MKFLLIGGTGTLSAGITRQLANTNNDVYIFNRGNRESQFDITGIKQITVDINDVQALKKAVDSILDRDEKFDVVADFILFNTQQLTDAFNIFNGRTKQFIFISSASVYQKPLQNYKINESTPLLNPYWEYARNKIACERLLIGMYRKEGFPITIVRPSHTYDERSIPLGVHGRNGSWQVFKRMLQGKQVIIHGDGTSLWTMTHNSDFARAFIGLMGNIHAIGQVVQITSDEVLTWNQIYQCIADAADVELRAIHIASDFLADTSDFDFRGSLLGDKANSVVFDNSKLKELVPGFVATVPFSRGVKETVDYVLSHSECQIADPEFDSWCDRVISVNQGARKAFN
ncbi:MAG: NAD-dependent dehydratase [Treponema sp. CETP13]|nr:MAG: NAD-dependent dehydratase [Treponema sp. CETP13]